MYGRCTVRETTLAARYKSTCIGCVCVCACAAHHVREEDGEPDRDRCEVLLVSEDDALSLGRDALAVDADLEDDDHEQEGAHRLREEL